MNVKDMYHNLNGEGYGQGQLMQCIDKKRQKKTAISL